MILIGICGASGSGKSTLADALANRLGDRCLVIQQDCYYRDHPDLSFTERAKLNYDEPGIFDHDLLLHDMNTLISGQPITRKAYDYTQHRRADTDELIYPHDVVILEGIHCFFDPRLMKLMFLKLYMKVDADICLLRRIERDILERRAQHRQHLRPVPRDGSPHVQPVYCQLCGICGYHRRGRRQERPHRGYSCRVRLRRTQQARLRSVTST
ncbi:MAG: AAA family ATPase [Faecalibacterium sp.]|nr:AAA family ATPase [Faecalibacterium sp.]